MTNEILNSEKRRSTELKSDAVIENPTTKELQASLADADFPRASQMAKEIFGEQPDDTSAS